MGLFRLAFLIFVLLLVSLAVSSAENRQASEESCGYIRYAPIEATREQQSDCEEVTKSTPGTTPAAPQ